jgi:hypothetical protein
MNKSLRSLRKDWNEGLLIVTAPMFLGMCANKGMLGYLPALGIGAYSLAILILSVFFARVLSAPNPDSYAEKNPGLFWNWLFFLAAVGMILLLAFVKLGTAL